MEWYYPDYEKGLIPLADWELELLQGEKVTEVAEQGSKVRVTYEAIVDTPSSAAGGGAPLLTRTDGRGGFFAVPEYAKVDVLEKPTPPEPPVGSVIQFENGAIFARTVRSSPSFDVWGHVNRARWTDTYWHTWKDAVRLNGKKFTHLGKPEIDLSGVQAFEYPTWKAEGDKAAYPACMGGGKVNVYRPDSGGHIRFQHDIHPVFCLYARDAIDMAKRILKTFGTEVK